MNLQPMASLPLVDEARLAEQSRTRATNLNSRGTSLELFGADVPITHYWRSHGTLLPWELTRRLRGSILSRLRGRVQSSNAAHHHLKS